MNETTTQIKTEIAVKNFAIRKLLGQLHVAVPGGSIWIGILTIENNIVSYGSENGVVAKIKVELKVSEKDDLFVAWKVIYSHPGLKFVSSEGDTLTTNPNAYSPISTFPNP
jgi:hypothetical protein